MVPAFELPFGLEGQDAAQKFLACDEIAASQVRH
jgi:hypothetical protein